jgi:hypothetical protein
MSGAEEQLHARAEMLDETGELATAVTVILAFASGAGVDPRAVISLRAAVAALDPADGAPGYEAGSRADRSPGGGYGSDAEFLEAVSEAEDQVADWLRDTGRLAELVGAAADRVQADLERAQQELNAAREALAAAYAMSTRRPCDGCHPAKAAAITAGEAATAGARQRIADAARRIGLCQDAAEILDQLARRLQVALRALRQVPHDLGEVYELIYAFIRRGGKMPRLGRWIQGGTPA